MDWKIKEFTHKASDGAEIKVTPKVTPKVAIEPNYKRLLEALLEEGVEGAATLTIDAALLAGPPLLAAIPVAQGNYTAREKGKLHNNILQGTVDARPATMSYAAAIHRFRSSGRGPALHRRRREGEAADVRDRDPQQGHGGGADGRAAQEPARDFLASTPRPARRSSPHTTARCARSSVRKEHYILAFWTEEADDVNAANKQVQGVFAHG